MLTEIRILRGSFKLARAERLFLDDSEAPKAVFPTHSSTKVLRFSVSAPGIAEKDATGGIDLE
ncbi:MAG: hypothetical protein QXR45_02115 [Candidatus Bathyarchaeia archaeon]|nr:hypothetical protein [Candidatus Bathyarchaeota archaeon]